MKICKIDGCKEKVDAKGLCRHHYYSFKKYGDPLKAPYRNGHPDKCTIEGCNRPYAWKGYCTMHYQRYLKYGDALHTKPKPKKDYPEYGVWLGLRRRCSDLNDKRFHNYGGRGIKVCKRWIDSFEVFLEDMGQRPFPKAQIDRINNDGDYDPENCRWVTSQTNNRNRSNNKLTLKQANTIREEYLKRNTSYRKLAIKYNVDPKLIFQIIKNNLWRVQNDRT